MDTLLGYEGNLDTYFANFAFTMEMKAKLVRTLEPTVRYTILVAVQNAAWYT